MGANVSFEDVIYKKILFEKYRDNDLYGNDYVDFFDSEADDYDCYKFINNKNKYKFALDKESMDDWENSGYMGLYLEMYPLCIKSETLSQLEFD